MEFASNGENFRKHKSISTIILTMQKPPEPTSISILYVFKSSTNALDIQTPNKKLGEQFSQQFITGCLRIHINTMWVEVGWGEDYS